MLSIGPIAPRFSPSQDIRVILSARPYGNVHYRQHPLDYLRIRTHRRAGRRSWPLQQDRIPAVEDETVVRRCARTRLVFDLGPGGRSASRSFGGNVDSHSKGIPRDKEGRQ
jgi:hypothetical protein